MHTYFYTTLSQNEHSQLTFYVVYYVLGDFLSALHELTCNAHNSLMK